jgi:hypothetical protein
MNKINNCAKKPAIAIVNIILGIVPILSFFRLDAHKVATAKQKAAAIPEFVDAKKIIKKVRRRCTISVILSYTFKL